MKLFKSRMFTKIKSFAKFLATGVKKTGAWLERNGASLAYVICFSTCLYGAFWAASSAPLPVVVTVLSIVGLLSLAETVE